MKILIFSRTKRPIKIIKKTLKARAYLFKFKFVTTKRQTNKLRSVFRQLLFDFLNNELFYY